MMALSWSAALSNCGRFLWLHSKPCSRCPVGLGRNWYYLLQPQKNSAKPWCDGWKCRHQQLYPPHWCSIFHIYHRLIYFIPPPRNCKRLRRVLLPAQWYGQYQLSKQDNHNGGGNISSSYAEPGPILTRVREWLLAGVAHVKAIVRPSKLTNKTLVLHCSGWFYAAACCCSLSFGWLNSVGFYMSSRESCWFSTAMQTRTELWQLKGGALCGKSGQSCSFNGGGWSTLISWLIRRGQVWYGVEGRRSCCNPKCQLLFSLALFTASKVSYDARIASTTVNNFPLMEGAMEVLFCFPFLPTSNLFSRCQLCPPPWPILILEGALDPFCLWKTLKLKSNGTFLLMKNLKLKAQAFAVPRCKRKAIM